jgi:selenocysteine lyase/cysteine desulfurase
MKSEKLKDASKEEILKVLQETENNLLKATQNLGHPAYGHSTATTMAVDELREELFDFLEIPKY